MPDSEAIDQVEIDGEPASECTEHCCVERRSMSAFHHDAVNDGELWRRSIGGEGRTGSFPNRESPTRNQSLSGTKYPSCKWFS